MLRNSVLKDMGRSSYIRDIATEASLYLWFWLWLKIRSKVAALEKKLRKQQSKLLALPEKFGFKSVDEMIVAMRSAAKESGHVAVSGAKKPRRKRATINAETEAKVKALVEKGDTGSKIAAAVGISVPSVAKIKKRLGLVGKKSKARSL
jgi:hypothetical protein